MNQSERPVLFLAPGAGLGHLVRVSAIAMGLEARGVSTWIVTSSSWTEGMSRLTGLAMQYIPLRDWKDQVRDAVFHDDNSLGDACDLCQPGSQVTCLDVVHRAYVDHVAGQITRAAHGQSEQQPETRHAGAESEDTLDPEVL